MIDSRNGPFATRVAQVCALALLAFAGCPAFAQDAPKPAPAIEPKVLSILKTACDTLSGAQTMSFTAVSTYERAARNGQPLYYATLNHVTMQRPDKLRVITPGDGVPDEFYYDGKTIMAYVPSADFVAVAEAPPKIDEMLDAAWEKAAIYFPFADVIADKPCEVINRLATSAFYVGQSVVIGGTTTDMVALAGEDIQAELWIGTSDHLPRLVRVTYPNEPAQAHYQTEYSDWRLGEAVDPSSFGSAKASAGKRMPFEPPASGEPPPASGEPPKQP